MSRPLKLLAVCLIAVALSLPATALGASSSRRAQLTNVTSLSYDCNAGANKGGAHEGSVKFTLDSPSAGYITLDIVVRHAWPTETYYIYLGPYSCANFIGYSLTTDSSGNAAGTFVAYGYGYSTFYVWMGNYSATDALATQAVTF